MSFDDDILMSDLDVTPRLISVLRDFTSRQNIFILNKFDTRIGFPVIEIPKNP